MEMKLLPLRLSARKFYPKTEFTVLGTWHASTVLWNAKNMVVDEGLRPWVPRAKWLRRSIREAIHDTLELGRP